MRRPIRRRPRWGEGLLLATGHLTAIDPVAVLHHSPTVARRAAPAHPRRDR
jgi:hypothetical protein